MGKNHYLIRRICIDGMLAGLYVALIYLTINFGNVRIGLGSTPVVLCALLFGPIDAVTVAMVGEFIAQVMRYGFTLTTPLWVIVPALRGLIIGIVAHIFRKKGMVLHKKPVFYFLTCIVAALVVTAANTATMLLDATIYQYPYALVAWETLIRFGTGMLTAVVVALVCLPLCNAVRFVLSPEEDQIELEKKEETPNENRE